MGWVSGIVVYLLVWWTVLFTVLPFGLKRGEDGKPENPRLLRKFWVTTGVSVLVWIVIYILIEADIISFREIARQMAEGDRRS